MRSMNDFFMEKKGFKIIIQIVVNDMKQKTWNVTNLQQCDVSPLMQEYKPETIHSA